MTTKNNKLRIGFMLDSSLDFSGGVQQYILVLADYYRTLGHEVHFIVGESSEPRNGQVHSLAKNFTVSFNGNKVNTPLPVSKKIIKEFINNNPLDILHIQMPYSPFYGARVIKYMPRTTAIVGTFHILPFGAVATIGTKFLAKILGPTVSRIDQVICVSEANQRFFKHVFKRDSIVLPNMVNVEDFKPRKALSNKSYDNVILYSGRLTERKGCRYLLDAAEYIKYNYPEQEFKLRFAGLGDQKLLLEKLAVQKGLEDHVEFSGYLSEKDKIKYMQTAKIACFPAYSGESFGIVLLEAMAARSGVVLAGDNPGYRTVLGTVPESIVNVKNTKVFADTIVKLLNDDKYRMKIQAKQQQLIDKFDYQVVGRQMLEVYKDCLKRKNT